MSSPSTTPLTPQPSALPLHPLWACSSSYRMDSARGSPHASLIPASLLPARLTTSPAFPPPTSVPGTHLRGPASGPLSCLSAPSPHSLLRSRAFEKHHPLFSPRKPACIDAHTICFPSCDRNLSLLPAPPGAGSRPCPHPGLCSLSGVVVSPTPSNWSTRGAPAWRLLLRDSGQHSDSSPCLTQSLTTGPPPAS